jgi:hypothetical protein
MTVSGKLEISSSSYSIKIVNFSMLSSIERKLAAIRLLCSNKLLIKG